MTADSFESVLGLLQMGVGNDNNSWGNNANAVFSNEAIAIAGVNVITNTSGTVDLSTVVPPAGLRLDLAKIQLANGTLSGDLTIKVPNISKTTEFWNQTSGAFNMFVQVPGGVARSGPNAPGGLVQIPQGACIKVKCDGNGNLIREDDKEIGNFTHSGKTAAGPGELACSGASLLRSEFPDLFGKIGTTWGHVDSLHFTLPLLTDTNRYLRAADGTNIAVGTYQSSQNLTHTHTVSGTTGTESAQHTHTQQGTFTTGGMSANDPHTHSVPSGGTTNVLNSGTAAGFTQTTSSQTTGATSIAHTHNVTISGATTTESATHTHTLSATTSSGSADGSEARPNSAAVLICIRY